MREWIAGLRGPWIDDVMRDVRHGLRMLRRSPGFTAVAVLTLALGIGANTAIFSIVNGVILRPLGYPQPDQLMYLTTQFPAFGFEQFWVSPPEYMEFRELNRSFSAVGAFTTGEVNLTAGDRPLRVRSASVDEHLLNALGVQPAQGRLFAKGETDVTGPPPAPGQPAPPPPRIVILSHELWQTAFRRTADRRADGRGQRPAPRSHRHHAARRRRDGQPHRDLDAARAESRPIARTAAATSCISIGRLKDGVTPQAAQTELDALIQNWGERTGAKNHVFVPARRTEATRPHPADEADAGGDSRRAPAARSGCCRRPSGSCC